MNKKDGVFYAKILLFGEYSIMCDSMALTVPYSHFSGELSFINEDKYTNLRFAGESNKSLLKFADYLKKQDQQDGLGFAFDLDRFRNDIDHGLYFESGIPQGFGLGSSGALVAAVYEKYASGGMSTNFDFEFSSEELSLLKKNFARMEGFFHGVSSGMDPLNCYLRSPLLIRPNKQIEAVGIPRDFSNRGGIFLVNTGKSGKTGPLVAWFFDQCKQGPFMKRVQNEMIPLTNTCIETMLGGQISPFFDQLKKLSRFLMTNLRPMIPENYVEAWQKGLDSGSYSLKLCGSGGGGFLLGFAEDLEKAQQELGQQYVEIIPVSTFQ